MTTASLRALAEAVIEMEKVLRAQDNRATAEPIFYVQQKRRVYGLDIDRFDAQHVWVREDERDIEADEEQSKALDDKHEEVYEDVIDGWERIGYADHWENVQPFFTGAGAERYIAENRHNLNAPRIYVASAYRNAEWIAARTSAPALARAVMAALELRNTIEHTAHWGDGHFDPNTVNMAAFCKCLRDFDAALAGLGEA